MIPMAISNKIIVHKSAVGEEALLDEDFVSAVICPGGPGLATKDNYDAVAALLSDMSVPFRPYSMSELFVARMTGLQVRCLSQKQQVLRIVLSSPSLSTSVT